MSERNHSGRSRCVTVRAVAAALLAIAVTTAVTAAPTDGNPALQPRDVLAKPDRVTRPAHDHRLTVKFHDHVRARAQPDGRIASRTGVDINAIEQLRTQRSASFAPLVQLPDATLQSIRTRAALRTGVAQPDLAGMMIVDAPANQLQALADALLASALTEWVYFQELAPPPPGVVTASGSPCADIAPLTPGYVDFQGYHGPDPGLNMNAAWLLADARGQGIKIADCEYGFNGNHEDLCDIVPEPGQTPHPNVASFGWDEHGTAVLGELVSAENAYGTTGLVPEAEAHFFPEWTLEEGFRRVTAITNAIATMDTGDIVLLEMQTVGAGGDYGPAEFDPAVWQVTKVGTDGGVIVVAAAGNGNQNLDSAAYSQYMSWGDSGAIIVGAGSATTGHDKLWFSTYGSRVNVQGWGQLVFTLGYGEFAEHGGDKNQRYTDEFGGTSSASPFIAAAAASIQSAVEQAGSARLSPQAMRALLIDTGIPQGTGGHIGPFPDMAAALTALLGAGDLNGDGVVDGADLALLLGAWGPCDNCDTPADCPADLNSDCVIDGADLAILLGNWD